MKNNLENIKIYLKFLLNKCKINVYNIQTLLLFTGVLALITYAMAYGFQSHTKETEKQDQPEEAEAETEIEFAEENEDTMKGIIYEEDAQGETKDMMDNSKLNVENTELKEVIKDVKTFEATSYTAFCDTGCTGITYTGYDVSDSITYNGMRIIAVDPDVIPLYSIVKVTHGNQEFKAIALDIGGAIQGNRIDILMKTRKAALEFGRQDVRLQIIKFGDDK